MHITALHDLVMNFKRFETGSGWNRLRCMAWYVLVMLEVNIKCFEDDISL